MLILKWAIYISFLLCLGANPVFGFVHVQESAAPVPGLNKHIELWQRRQDKNPGQERWLVEQVYLHTHQRFLATYQNGAPLSDLYASGKYDCVTGSWVLGTVYEALGFKVTVHELNFHVFLWIDGERRSYLIESTAPNEGVWIGKRAHQQLVQIRQQDSIAWAIVKQNPLTAHFLVATCIQNEYNLSALRGLYYYNQAIWAFDRREYDMAHHLLQQGMEYCRSKRMKSFMYMLTNVRWESMPEEKRMAEQFVRQYVADLKSEGLTPQ
ncbi:MAG TPA: hypothetical protein DCE41_04415 [Cytophagales bacterium]|nr:hypothetical protein [Cytophagales bacterium]